jgi:small-conductance mechanosensitive channel
VFLIGRTWFEGFQSLSTFLGLLSAGVAIALKDPLVNLAGWAFIIWRKPFGVGDRIQLGDYQGDVIDQRLFAFTLMEIGNWVDAEQSTGRVIHVPNGKVFNEGLANYSRGFQYIWDEIPVLVTFESNWRKAKQILLEIGRKHGESLSESAEERIRRAARKFMIFYTKLTPTVYTCVKDCGVMLTIRYLCEPRQRRTNQQAIWEDILDAFEKCNDIDFAYPTQRFYNNMSEGKEGARANLPAFPKDNLNY